MRITGQRENKSWGKFLKLSSFLLLFAVAACGGSSGGGSQQSTSLGGGFHSGEVRELSFNGNNEASVTFSELSGSEEFAFVFFAANVNAGAFNVQLKGLGADVSSAKFLDTTIPQENLTDGPSDPTSVWHEQLRKEEAKYIGMAPYNPNTTGKALADISDIPCGENGIQLKVLGSLGSNTDFVMTCAIPVRQTNNAIYYVDQEAINVVTADYLNPIIDNFESKIAEEHSLIGNESDVNNSGNFSVYLTPAVNRLGANQGGFVTGFYFGGDLFPAANTPASNQREIFYSSVPDPNGTWGVVMDKAFWASNIGPTVFPHEFQHMISFNQHVILRNSGAEEAWANEGFSHFFEDLDMNTHFDRVGLENPSRVALFLSSPENSPFTGGTSISQRGGSYLFFRYLYEQANLGRYPGIASGDDLLRQLIDSDMKGVENIQNVTNTDFKDLLLNFYTTLQISNSGVNLDPTYNFKGINIRAAQNDNRGTVLKGVTTHPFTTAQNSGSVSSPGGLFYDASGSNITSAGQTLNFVGATGMEPGGAVIRLH